MRLRFPIYNRQKNPLINKRSQSALEYMMTYGWAILIIVIVAAVLYSFGIFSPSSSISATITGFSNLGSVTAQCYSNGVLRIQLGNNIGNTINITKITATGNSNTVSFSGNSTVDPNPEIVPGGTYTFSLSNICPRAGSKFSVSVSVNYTEPGQTFSGPYLSSGTVSGRVSLTVQPLYVAFFTTSSIISIIKSNLNFPNSSSVSLVAWVNVGKETYDTQNPQFDPISLGNSSACGYHCGDLRFNGGYTTSGPWPLEFVHGGAQPNSFTPSMTSWYLVVGVYNASDTTASLYFNNAESAGGGYSGTSAGSDSVFIGAPDGGHVTDVMMSGIQVYKSALNHTQIISIYNSGLMSKQVSNTLFGWWPLNGTAEDYSGNGNNGLQANIVYTSNYQAP